MQFLDYNTHYEPVMKNEGAKSIPPLSSLVILFSSFRANHRDKRGYTKREKQFMVMYKTM